MRRFLPSAMVLLAAGLTLTITMPDGVVPRATLADEAVTDSNEPEWRPTQAEIAALIERLSHDDYQVREPVSAKLVQIGIAARPLLLEALASPDLEIRHRATRILTIIVEEDFQTRVTAFANDVDGKNKVTLPGWSRFGERLPPDKYGRALFVEMHQSESELLGVYDRVGSDARVVSHAFSSRCREIEEMPQTYRTRLQSEISLGTIATLILIGSEPAVATTDEVSLLVTGLVRRGAFVTAMRANSKQPLLRKMLGDWIAKSTITNNTRLIDLNLNLAMEYNLEEGLGPAVQIVNKTAIVPRVRSRAALAIGKLGTAENLPDLEPLLEDVSLCYSGPTITISNKTKRVNVQLRDVALAVMVHLSGQQLSDYGYLVAKTNSNQLFNLTSLAFYDEESRDRALAKWKAWSSREQRGEADPSATDEGRKAKTL